MPIADSKGGFYKDAFAHESAGYDPHTYDPDRSEFQKNIDSKIKDAAFDDMDADLVRNPIEIQTGDTENNVINADQFLQNNISGSDPRNIYDDSGSIVDYDLKHLSPSQ